MSRSTLGGGESDPPLPLSGQESAAGGHRASCLRHHRHHRHRPIYTAARWGLHPSITQPHLINIISIVPPVHHTLHIPAACPMIPPSLDLASTLHHDLHDHYMLAAALPVRVLFRWLLFSLRSHLLGRVQRSGRAWSERVRGSL